MGGREVCQILSVEGISIMKVRRLLQVAAAAFVAVALFGTVAPQASAQPPEDRPDPPAGSPGCDRSQSRAPCEVPPPAPPGPPEWAGQRNDRPLPSDDEILAAESGVPLERVQAHTSFVEKFNGVVNEHLLSSEHFAWFEVDTDFNATGLVRFTDAVPARRP